MTEPNTTTTPPSPPASGAAGSAPRVPASAGALLREAREAAGMSLDTVAQQLKLAPRQVTALEEGNFAALPGRTFVRGFMRNYARLVRVDPEIVLTALAGRETPSLDSPALQPTAPTMGELPNADYGKPGWTRWAIPLTLVAVIAAAAIYEFTRSHSDTRGGAPPAAVETDRASPAQSGAPAAETAPAPATTPPGTQPAAPGTPGAVTQALPNPVATTAPVAPAEATPAGAAAKAEAPGAAGEPLLVLVYRESSWTQVKDAGGNVLVAQTVAAGQTRSIAGTPPFELVLGNSNAATVTFRGKPVDLAPYSRGKVARLVLQ